VSVDQQHRGKRKTYKPGQKTIEFKNPGGKNAGVKKDQQLTESTTSHQTTQKKTAVDTIPYTKKKKKKTSRRQRTWEKETREGKTATLFLFYAEMPTTGVFKKKNP